MKKLLFLTIYLCSALAIQAQWTDNGSNLTTTDNVGIGTTTPDRPLHIRGSGTVNAKVQSTDSNAYWIADIGGSNGGVSRSTI